MKLVRWIGVALAVVVVGAGVMLISQSASGSPPVPATCPQQWGGDGIGGWVPAAADVDGVGESLVPGAPVQALICAYPGTNARPGGERLGGTRTLTDQARVMARDLAYLPVTATPRGGLCTQMGGPMTNYLIRFAYPDGRALWVGSAEEVNSCVTTTNGTAGSRSYVGPSITAAYRAGTWKPARSDDPCRGRLAGRRGQNEQMVPEGVVSVVVCGQATSYTGKPPRLEHGRQVAHDLAATLSSLDTWPSEHMCQGGTGADDREFRLLFGYPDGPPADVRISVGCTPGIDNGLLQADLGDPVRDQVARLAPPA
ncbi:hypothetical protein GCM10010404_27700 [Nonomuraea africana]|uniref:Uncharacterized protein n=1 Tax=Nonomuraea africana TaxID=46171 RepID=A0ABR9KPA3_9ACTN|nr:hypothetical protein [Nonomuraea africana]MBE1563591.1 hypothetical protein [Nonomuraea africana]